MASYTRQSSFSDGDTITAALFNNEYNQLLNAFAYASSSTTGHRHDGTTAEGGNIHTIGDQDFLNKIVADSTNDRWGVFVQVSSSAVEQIRISDGVISPVTDNDIDLGTSSLEFKDLFIDGTAHIDTLDVDVNATVAGTLGVTGALTGSSTIQGTTITATTAFVPDASDGAALGTSALEFSDLFLADGAVINFGDDQDVSLTHVADTGLLLSSTDQLQFGDSGTYIYQSADGVLDLVSDTEIELTATTIDINGAVAMDGAITGGTNITISGELDAATLDISGNADIDGTTNLDIVDIDGAVQIDATVTVGVDDTGYDVKFFGDTASAYMLWDTSADDLILGGAARVVVPASGLVIGSTAVTSTGAELNILDGVTSTAAELNILDGVTSTAAELNILDGVTSTAAELNIIDGDTSATSTTLADADRVVVNDAGTMKQVALTDFETYFESAIDTFSTIDIDGGSIDGATLGTNSAITQAVIDDIDLNGKVITMTGSSSDTAVFTAGTNGTLSIVTTDAAAAAANIQITADGTVDIDSAGILTLDSGAAINIEPASGSAILLDGTISIDAGVVTGATSVTSTAFVGALTGNVTGNASGTAATVTTAAQSAITSLGTLTTLTVDDITINGATIYATDLILGEDAQTAIDFGTANEIDFKVDNAARLTLTSGALYPVTNNQIDLGTSSLEFKDAFFDGTVTADAFAGPLTGNADTATTLATARTIGGTSFDGSANIAVALATLATTVTVTDNESTDEDNAILFTAGGDVDGGSLGLESDGTLTYNPSTGKVTATGFVGTLTGNVTGNTSGTAATVTTAAQSSITSLGTLTTLTVDSVIINGTNIGHTSDTDSIAIASDGVVTFSQAPVFPDGSLALADLDIDGGTDVGAALVDADLMIVDDGAGGTNRKATLARLKTYIGAGAADDLTIGDAAVSVATTVGNITIDAQANDADVIIKVDDAGASVTAVTFDGSAAGAATFNDKIIATELDISGNIDIDGTANLDAVDIDGAVQIDSTVTVGVDDTGYDVKFFGDTASAYMLWDTSTDDLVLAGAAGLVIPDGGNIGSATTPTAIDILGTGEVGIGYSGITAAQLYAYDNSTGRTGVRVHLDNASSTQIGVYVSHDGAGVSLYGHTQGASYGVFGQSEANYGVYGKTASASYGGVLGYASGAIYGILGYQNTYSLYGNGTSVVSGGHTTSDERLKDIQSRISTSDGVLSKINQLKPTYFTWKADTDQANITGEQIGFMAQEVETIFPHLVLNNTVPQMDELPELEGVVVPAREKTINETLGNTKSVAYEKLVCYLTSAIQELSAKNDALEARVAALET